VDTVILDKTGTLTLGKLRLAGLQSFGDCSDADILAAAAAVERTTRHPLAAAIIAAAEEAGVHACLDFVPDACIDQTPTTSSMMC
jgi:cation transport ATPase